MRMLRELCGKYTVTDSISEREKLEKQIAELCRAFIFARENLYRKYEFIGPVDDEYLQEDSGNLRFSHLFPGGVGVRYHPNWNCSNECDIRINVKYEDFENFDAGKLEKQLRERKLAEMKQKLISLKSEMAELEKKIIEF
jgi:hypothetical protein